MVLQNSSFLPSILLAVVLGGSQHAVSAAPLFLNDTITARIPSKDLPSFRNTIIEVLNHAADGATTPWNSSDGASRHQVRTLITPLQTAQTQKANTCRLLDVKVSQLQSAEKWEFWFCRDMGGVWKASGSRLPR